MNTEQLLEQILLQLNKISINIDNKDISPNIIVAIITAFVAISTLIYNKRKEIKIRQLNLKEEKYISFLSALIAFRAGLGTAEEITKTVQVMYLIANSEVINNISKFLDLLIDKNNSSSSQAKEKTPEEIELSKLDQERRYCNLIAAMRSDLYGKKSNKNFPNNLQLIIFTK